MYKDWKLENSNTEKKLIMTTAFSEKNPQLWLEDEEGEIELLCTFLSQEVAEHFTEYLKIVGDME